MVCLLLLFGCLQANAQITPLKPAVGDTLRFLYTPLSEEPVYAGIMIRLEDGSVTKTHILLHRTGVKAQGVYCLPERSASLRVRFYTIRQDDGGAAQSLMVYEADHQTPVRSAYLDALYGDYPDSLFALELRNHPDNYLAYDHYINVASMLMDPVSTQHRIKMFCTRLDSIYRSGARSPGLLAALCVGYAKSERLDAARWFLLALFHDHPLSQETAFAFSLYNYEYYKSSNQDIEPPVLDSLKALFLRYPLAKISGDANVLYFMSKDTTIPLSSFEAAYTPLYRENGTPYYALGALPRLYMDRGQRLDSARVLLLSALRQFEDGSIQHQFRLTVNHYKSNVPQLLLDLGRLDLMQGDPSGAVLHTSAGLDILHGSNSSRLDDVRCVENMKRIDGGLTPDTRGANL